MPVKPTASRATVVGSGVTATPSESLGVENARKQKLKKTMATRRLS